MDISIKELAEELGVSKPTISKAIDVLGIQGNLRKVGNRFMLDETQVMAVKSQITQIYETEIEEKTQEKTLQILAMKLFQKHIKKLNCLIMLPKVKPNPSLGTVILKSAMQFSTILFLPHMKKLKNSATKNILSLSKNFV